jgi:hypothetical protein
MKDLSSHPLYSKEFHPEAVVLRHRAAANFAKESELLSREKVCSVIHRKERTTYRHTARIPSPLPLCVAKTGSNYLNEEFTPLLPTGIGERF